MIRIRTTTGTHRRLRPGWTAGLAAAISRRTREAKTRDAVARFDRAMQPLVREARRFGDAAKGAAEAMATLAPAWKHAARRPR